MKLKTIVNTLLIIFIAIGLISCSLNEKTSGGEKAKYTFLFVPSENTSDTIRDSFADAGQYGLYSTTKSEQLSDLQKDTKKGIAFPSEDLKYAYSQCTYKNNSSEEFGAHYSVYDVYLNDHEEVAYLHGTDLVCSYFNRSGDLRSGVSINTDDEAKVISDEFVLSIISEDIFSGFECTSITKDNSGLFSYVINYSKLTLGHKTDENITIYIDNSGTVVGYNGYNVCKYDDLVKEFNNDSINSAKSALITRINGLNLKNTEIGEPFLTTSADGELYLRINFTYEDENGFACGETVLINVI